MLVMAEVLGMGILVEAFSQLAYCADRMKMYVNTAVSWSAHTISICPETLSGLVIYCVDIE